MTAVLIMTDGMRPDALPQVNTPHLDALQARSAYTMAGSSVMPSVTLPCHTSIFHSVPPQRHGIVTNVWQPMARPLPGLVDQAHASGKRCHFYHNWEPLRDLNRPETLDFSYYRNNCYTPDGDNVIAAVAAAAITAERPDSRLRLPGHHRRGRPCLLAGCRTSICARPKRWTTPSAQLAALTDADTVLLYSDHTAADRTHGTDAPEDSDHPPDAIAGPGIRRDTPSKLRSRCSTLRRRCAQLNVPVHPHWEGGVRLTRYLWIDQSTCAPLTSRCSIRLFLYDKRCPWNPGLHGWSR
ncbi:MAG: alkaline phosphatase family protein [Caldilineaceae bacterium]